MLTIDWLSGHCPVQAEGAFDDAPFYYRSRHGHWTVEMEGCGRIIAEGGDRNGGYMVDDGTPDIVRIWQAYRVWEKEQAQKEADSDPNNELTGVAPKRSPELQKAIETLEKIDWLLKS